MAWVQHRCQICNGIGKVDIGRNIDNKPKSQEPCPICQGKGWLQIFSKWWGLPHKRFPKDRSD